MPKVKFLDENKDYRLRQSSLAFAAIFCVDIA